MLKQISVQYDLRTITITDNHTEVEIMNTHTGELFYGEADRNPKDAMDYNIGITLAERRAVADMLSTLINDDIDDVSEGMCETICDSLPLTEVK